MEADDLRKELGPNIDEDNESIEDNNGHGKSRLGALSAHKGTSWEDARLTKAMTSTMLFFEKGMLAFALISITLAIFAKQIEFKNMVEARDNKAEENIVFYLLALNIWSSILMAITNILRKYHAFRLRKIRKLVHHSDSFLSNKMLLALVAQSIILTISPIPAFTGKKACLHNVPLNKQICYNLNDILHIFQFVKFLFLGRAYTQGTKYATSRAYRLCGYYDCENKETFLVRCMMQDRPLSFIASIFVFGIMLFGYALRIAETPLWTVDKTMDYYSYFNCMWNVLITMTTVGYGDMYPRTIMGRLIVLVCCIYGNVVMSLLVSSAHNNLILTKNEACAVRVIDLLGIRSKLRTNGMIAANRLGRLAILRGYKNKISPEKYTERQESIIAELSENSKDAKLLNNLARQIRRRSTNEVMESDFYTITQDIKELKWLALSMRDEVLNYHPKHQRTKLQ